MKQRTNPNGGLPSAKSTYVAGLFRFWFCWSSVCPCFTGLVLPNCHKSKHCLPSRLLGWDAFRRSSTFSKSGGLPCLFCRWWVCITLSVLASLFLRAIYRNSN